MRLRVAGSGDISFDELYEFIRGKRHSLDRRYALEFVKKKFRPMALELPEGADYTLFDLVWDMDTFRALLAITLDKHRITSSTLLKAWDETNDGSLNRTEFMQKVKSTFFSTGSLEALWNMDVGKVAGRTFNAIAGATDSSPRSANRKKGAFDLHIDVIELEKWLTKANSEAGGFVPTLKKKKKKNGKSMLKKGESSRRIKGIDPESDEASRMSQSQSMPEIREGRAPAGPPPKAAYLRYDPTDSPPIAEGSLKLPSLFKYPQPAFFDRSEWPTSKTLSPPRVAPPRPTRLKPLPPTADSSEDLETVLPGPKPLPTAHRSPHTVPHRTRQNLLEFADVQKLVTLIGEGSDVEISNAEKQYAHLCMLKEITPTPETRRLMREKSASLCHTYNSLGSTCTECSPEMAHTLLKRARACVGTADDVALTITTLAHLGMCHLHLGNAMHAVADMSHAVRLESAHTAEHPSAVSVESRVRLRLNLCAALCRVGSHAEALAHANAAAALASRTDDRVQLAITLHNICVCHEFLGKPAKALAAAERALELARGSLPEDDKLRRRLHQVASSLAQKVAVGRGSPA